MAPSGVSVSVVILALNERDALERTLAACAAPGVERIVVDGGSTDGTPEVARFLRVDALLTSEPGRARQMNAGLRAASGDAVLFLHADTRLEPGWLEALAGALADSRVAGGAFRLAFDSPRARYRVMELGVRLRCALVRLPFGDQGLFARRKWLDEAGGLPDTPIFEDLDLVRRIRRNGRLALLPVRAVTSTRRYERNGWLRQVTRNLLALAAFGLRVNRADVARWYRGRPSA